MYMEDLKKKPEDQKKLFARERGTNRFGLKYYKQEYTDACVYDFLNIPSGNSTVILSRTHFRLSTGDE